MRSFLLHIFALAIAAAALDSAALAGQAGAEPRVSQAGYGSEQIWLGPRKADFMPIIDGSVPAAPWNEVAGRVEVVTAPEAFVRSLPDDSLARLVQDLDRRHIALGLGILPTNWFHETPECGHGVEGYSDPGSTTQVVTKLKKAGAHLRFIAMDEPLWFGHYYSGKNACRSSLDNLAERVSVLVKIYTAAFPDVVIGDTEPFPAVSAEANWVSDYASWLDAFHKATGARPSFLQLDFNWGDPRLNVGSSHDGSNAPAVTRLLREVSTVARRNGLKVGMIYWGGGANDSQWMDNARLHIREIAASGVKLDQAAFVSWNPAPKRTFPATDPNALSNLVLYLLQQRR